MLLLPHEPNLGLRPAVHGEIGQFLIQTQSMLTSRLALAVRNLRQGDAAPSKDKGVGQN